MRNRKTIGRKGFTLAETLVAVLILLMVSGIVAAGIPAAKNAYDKVVLRSNAEMVMSTAIYALRNELSVARDIKVNGTTIDYISGTYESKSEISVDNSKGGILYKRYAGSGDAPERLVSLSASDSNNKLYVTYTGVSYVKDDPTHPEKKNYITFTGLNVYKSGSDTPLVQRDPFSVTVF